MVLTAKGTPLGEPACTTDVMFPRQGTAECRPADGAAKTVRLCIGTFTESDALAKALLALAAHAPERRQRPYLVAPTAPTPNALGEAARLCSVGDVESLYAFLGWLSEPQVGRLETHVRNGGFVLIVSSETPQEQDESCRILLRHSRHGIQTHDFTLRTPAAR